MKSSKTTKRALLGSLTSLVLCFAMLIGSTFAWFTDSASTSVNTIQAGTLDVELQMWDTAENKWVDAEGKTLDFIKATDAPGGEAVLWEPGATYELPSIRIVNKGNLALKYEVYLTAAGGDLELAKVLKVNATAGNESLFNGATPTLETVLNAAAVPANGATNGYIHGKLGTTDNDNATAEITISMTMDQNATNEYQGKSISNIAVTVVATQDTVEYDSNNNTYDQNAEYPTVVRVADDSALESAISNAQPGQVIALNPGSSYELPSSINNAGVEIDGNGATVSVPENEGLNRVWSNGTTFKNVVFEDSGKLWIKDAATFVNCTFKCEISNAEPVEGTVTFENCTFEKAVHFAPAANGVATTGKFFEAKGCTFTGNLTVMGFERVTLTNCTLTGSNWAGANMISYCPVTFNNCTLANGVRLAQGMTAADVTCNGCAIQVKLPAA